MVIINPSGAFTRGYVERPGDVKYPKGFYGLPYYSCCKVSSTVPFVSAPAVNSGGPFYDYKDSILGYASDATIVKYNHLEAALQAKGRMHISVFTEMPNNTWAERYD